MNLQHHIDLVVWRKLRYYRDNIGKSRFFEFGDIIARFLRYFFWLVFVFSQKIAIT